MNAPNEERLLDLLCKQVSEGLTADEQNELSDLVRNVDSSVDLASLELTAAAIAMSPVGTSETLPDHLKAGILARADEYFANANAKEIRNVRDEASNPKPTISIWGWLGWAAAAAACIALAINIYQTRGDERAQNMTPTPTPVLRTPSATEMRQQLLASTTDVVRTDWGPGNMKDLTIAGDVVWSDAKQEGYMRFRNLPKNDVSAYTYQLWIFDETQDEKTPIDGGIFDVNADGEIVIPIDAKLRARGARAFAITMEKPGGVMVSKREKVVTLAAVKPSSA
jgi:anti-sigma-K factor RskA